MGSSGCSWAVAEEDDLVGCSVTRAFFSLTNMQLTGLARPCDKWRAESPGLGAQLYAGLG